MCVCVCVCGGSIVYMSAKTVNDLPNNVGFKSCSSAAFLIPYSG